LSAIRLGNGVHSSPVLEGLGGGKAAKNAKKGCPTVACRWGESGGLKNAVPQKGTLSSDGAWGKICQKKKKRVRIVGPKGKKAQVFAETGGKEKKERTRAKGGYHP